MKKKAKRLVELPFSKSVRIAYQSIRARFFRSLVTTSTLVLAVAFLCYSLIGFNIAQGILLTGDPELQQILAQNGYDLETGVTLKGSAKQRWIIILSLLVCTVGIINAQLMSVTERFREIGTMKCLGALDRFVVRIFVIEAAMQGFTGSFLGAIVGGFTAIVSGLVTFNTLDFLPLIMDRILVSSLLSILVGMVLSLIGVLYPAFLAASMQPVEAMRVEQ
ncbi:MAG: FtsX-like permease family protein [Thermodesulfobacteriota bacterium]